MDAVETDIKSVFCTFSVRHIKADQHPIAHQHQNQISLASPKINPYSTSAHFLAKASPAYRKVLNECEIHLSGKFQQFQARFVEVEKSILTAIDGLHEYWNRFEEIASRKVLELKSPKEQQLEELIKKSEEKHEFLSSNHQNTNIQSIPRNHLFQQNLYHHKNSKSHILSTLLKSQLSNSKNSNKKLGQMSNKKRGKISILQSGEGKMMNLITDWCFGIDKEEKPISFEEMRKLSDAWADFYHKQKDHEKQLPQMRDKNYGEKKCNTSSNQTLSSSSHINYRTQESLDDIINRTYPSSDDIQSLYYYDQYGQNQNFSLQHPLSNLVQSRLQFQSQHYCDLEASFHQINQNLVENQKKADKLLQKQKRTFEGLSIGFKKVDKEKEKKQLEKFILQGFDQEFLPQVIHWQDIDKEEENIEENPYSYEPSQGKQIQRNKVLQNLARFSTYTSQPVYERPQIEKTKPQLNGIDQSLQQRVLNKPLESSSQLNQTSPKNIQNQLVNQKSSTFAKKHPPLPQYQPTLLSSLIQSFFMNIETKYSRLAKQQKVLKTFYFPSLEIIPDQTIKSYIEDVERIFLVLEEPNISLVRMEKLYNLHKQVIKCFVYQFGSEIKEIQKDLIRKKITSCFNNQFTVTFSFKLIDTSKTQTPKDFQLAPKLPKKSILSSLPCKNLPSVQCLAGLLTVMIYEEKPQQSQYETEDYLSKGEQLVKQYEMFFLQDKQNQIQNYNEFIKFDSGYYQKLAKINYVFDLSIEEGVVFEKLSEVIDKRQQEQEIEVFMAKKHNRKGKYSSDQEQPIEEDQNQNQKAVSFFDAFSKRVNSDIPTKKVEQPPKDQNAPPQKPEEKQQITNEEKVKELQFDDKNLVSIQSGEGMKRSNSREELKNISTSNLVFEVFEVERRREEREQYMEEGEDVQRQENLNQENSVGEIEQEHQDEDFVGL